MLDVTYGTRSAQVRATTKLCLAWPKVNCRPHFAAPTKPHPENGEDESPHACRICYTGKKRHVHTLPPSPCVGSGNCVDRSELQLCCACMSQREGFSCRLGQTSTFMKSPCSVYKFAPAKSMAVCSSFLDPPPPNFLPYITDPTFQPLTSPSYYQTSCVFDLLHAARESKKNAKPSIQAIRSYNDATQSTARTQ